MRQECLSILRMGGLVWPEREGRVEERMSEVLGTWKGGRILLWVQCEVISFEQVNDVL